MNKIFTIVLILIIISALTLSACSNVPASSNDTNLQTEKDADEMDGTKVTVVEEKIDIDALIEEKNLSTIYLAGGCFWGVEEYMSRIAGVYDASSGYANGNTENPSYEDVIYNNTGHAETVRVVYDASQVTLKELLDKFFLVVDPTSVNQQGNDIGSQYRSGVYYTDENDLQTIESVINELEQNYDNNIAVEVLPLDNYYAAEDYHQDYLQKNVNGYCHINLEAANENYSIDSGDYVSPDEEELKSILSELEYKVTQNEGTERAFTSELNDNKEVGIYVDKVTGEPLFLSTDKYDSGTGWPSFTKPIAEEVIVENEGDTITFGIEVKSRSGESHLGHVFADGPTEEGGLRYCINGAALNFIPYNSMVEEGYGYLKHLFVNDSDVTIIPAE